MRVRVCAHALVAVAVVVCGWALVTVRAADPPKPPPNTLDSNPDWGTKPPTEVAPGADWGAATVNIPIPRKGNGYPVTYAPSTNPTVIVGNEVYSLRDSKLIARLDGTYDRGPTALSVDGRYFAAMAPEKNGVKAGAVNLWDTATGQVAQTFDIGDKDREVQFLAINTKHLIAACRGNNDNFVEVWDIATGKCARNFGIDGQVGPERMALTPDGRYLAVVGRNHLRVFNVTTGNPAVTMRQPVVLVPPRVIDPKRPAPKPEAIDVVFLYAWCRGIAFSPTGKELLGVFDHQGPRLIIWDNQGNVVLNEPLPVEISIHNSLGNVIGNPEGTHVLIQGRNLFDRKLKRIVWRTEVPWATDVPPRFIKTDTVVLPRGGARGETLEAVQLPMDRLSKSIAAMNSPKAAAHYKPGQSVSVQVDVQEVRFGDRETTRKQLEEAIAARLTKDGIKVAPGQPTTVFISYDEKAGGTAKVVEKTSPFDRVGRDTGKTVEDSRGIVVIELRVKGQDKPVWSTEDKASSARSFRGEVTDQVVRTSMFESMVGKIRELELPFFLPADNAVEALPIIDEHKER